ncbi:MAG: ABC transporter ATP-binding protein [Clostridia bacterium]
MGVFSGLKKYKKDIIIACLLIGLASLCDLMLPTIMSEIIDNGINKNDMPYIYILGLIMLLIAALGMVCYIISAKRGARVVNGFGADLVNKVFCKVNTMNFDQFSVLGPSALLTRTTEDVQMLTETVYFFIRIIVALPLMFVGGIFLSFSKDVLLSIILFAFLPILVILILVIGKKMFVLYEKSDEYVDKQNQIMRERLSGIRVIRAFNRENTEHDRIVDATNIMADNIIKSNIRGGIINPISLLMLNVVIVIIVIVGGNRIIPHGKFSGADVIAVIQYITLIMNSIMMFSWAILFLPHVKVKINRINQVMQIDTRVEHAKTDAHFNGRIKTEHLSFKYDGSEEMAIKDINLDIKPGQTAAFIGGTGCGKTTVLQLLMGFYKPTEGKIYYDNYDFATLNAATIRDNVSCALQKSTVFSSTIKENIKMGKANATDEEVAIVAEIAEAASFIENLPEKYDYILEQEGSNLSGGQKQRIAIARAIIKEAGIYIFDDSFSALDFLTESRLRKKLNNYIKGKTQIVITQRISTGMNADIIYVFDQGKIIGNGTHKQLMKNCSVYQEIYRSQIGGDLDAR